MFNANYPRESMCFAPNACLLSLAWGLAICKLSREGIHREDTRGRLATVASMLSVLTLANFQQSQVVKCVHTQAHYNVLLTQRTT